MTEEHDWLEKLDEIFNFHQNIIDIMLRHRHDDNTCHVSQMTIAKGLGVSQTLVSMTLQKLYREGSVEQFKKRQYIVRHADLKKEGLYPKLVKMLAMYVVSPELLQLSYNAQAEFFGVETREIQEFWGYMKYVSDNFAE